MLKSIVTKALCGALALLAVSTAGTASVPAYRGITGEYVTTETVGYTGRTVTEEIIAAGMPSYADTVPNGVNCAPLAGAAVLAYYDVVKNVIPAFNVGVRLSSGAHYYVPQNANVNNMISSLTSKMGTNANGTTVRGFQNGLNGYLSGSGYSASYASMMSGDALNESDLRDKYAAKIPVVVFMEDFEFVNRQNFAENSYQDVLTVRHCSGGHVMATYGYRKIRYYSGSVLVRTDVWLLAAYGDGNLGYLNAENVKEAYSVTI